MKFFFTLLAVFLSFGAFAQEFSGKAIYQKKVVFKTDNIKPENDTPERRERWEAISKSMEKVHFLEFTKDESVYTEEPKLPTKFKTASGSTASTSMSEAWKKIYKNLKENYFLMDMDDYIIKDTIHSSGWELSTESKQIGNYTVYKATRTVKPIKTDNNFLSTAEKEPKDIVYTAWYTPEIPIPNGPDTFGGLPGLILELHNPYEVYLCSEIVLNPKKPIEIKKPKGKIISQEEYDKRRKERRENYKRQNSTNRNR